jgi:hypothetical protein
MNRYFRLAFLCVTFVFGAISSFSQDAVPSKPDVKAGYHIYGHAHNDYEHERPLLDALDNKFYCVEADFWLVDGQLMVSHNKGDSIEDYKGTLQELYLDPLQKRVDEMGSVHDDGLPFYLWLDIKDGRDEMHPVLHEALKEYSMLSTFSNGKAEQKPVTIILTGDHESKSSYVDKYDVIKVCRDSNYYKADDPNTGNKWLWYALNWNNYIKWNGTAPIPDEEYKKLVGIVNDAHAKGRKVRFYSTPDMPSYWDLALRVGIDHINTDKLAELNAFLESKKK